MVSTHAVVLAFALLSVPGAMGAESAMMQAQTYLSMRSFVSELNPSDFKVVVSEPQQTSMAMIIYLSSMVSMVLLVAALFWSKGLLIIFRVVAYLLALSTVTLTIKNVYVNYHYNFSKFVSVTHFVSAGVLCFGIVLYRRQTDGKPIKVPSAKQFFCMILPTAIAFASGIGANNQALMYSNAGFVEMIAGGTPLCTLLCTAALGKKVDLRLIWPVLLVCSGIVLCTSGELKFSTMGFMLASFACFSRAIKSTLQHALMDTEDASIQALDPIELLAWMSLPSIAIMGTWSVCTEGIDPYARLVGEDALGLLLAIGLTCVNACILNVANLFVIRDLGAVATTLAAQLKGILIILGGVAMLGEVVQVQQIAGFSIILGGVFWYNRTQDMVKAEAAKIKEPKESTPLAK